LAATTAPAHGVEHHINTVGQLAAVKFQHLDPVRLEAAKKEFHFML
jgi:hypothetical protein